MDTTESVREFLETMKCSTWFSLVGSPLQYIPSNGMPVEQVGTWMEARRIIETEETIGFLTETQNELYEQQRLETTCSGIRFPNAREFNNWIRATRPNIQAVVDVACSAPGFPKDLTEKYSPILRWIVSKGAVIHQFGTVLGGKQAYPVMIDILRSGHCVCGWRGRYPEGRLVVY